MANNIKVYLQITLYIDFQSHFFNSQSRYNVCFWILQKEGKKNNIRALLCSMHTILWDDAKWNKCEIHQLVSATDVKKAYRKACLAVHPDKVILYKWSITKRLTGNKISASRNRQWEPSKVNIHGVEQCLERFRKRFITAKYVF